MKFVLFDSEHKFHPNVLIWAFEIRDNNGNVLEQKYFLFKKSVKKFFESNRENVPSECHMSYGGEVLWLN